MPTPSYIKKLRKSFGHGLLIAPAVNAIVRDRQGRVLICLRRDTNEWALPGGIVEPGESVLKAVHREVREETGISCRIHHLTGLYSSKHEIITYPNKDRLHVVVATFLCTTEHTKLQSQTDETTGAAFVSPAKAFQLLSTRYRRRMRDALSKKKSAQVT